MLSRSTLLVGAALFLLMLLAGCPALQEEMRGNGAPQNKIIISNSQDNTTAPCVEKDCEDDLEDTISFEIAAREVKANEAGQVMILMYHDIGQPEGEWRRTPENFRRDLQNLYKEGFRPVSLNNYLEGKIDIPAGTSPVIITFDDGHQNQFNFLKDSSNNLLLDPDCAVGIMEAFSHQHPDFEPLATFYVYYPLPFRQKELIEDKFRFLIELGMEIGNHTYSHENLRHIPADKAVQELALHQAETEKYLPGYTVRTLALPYGAYPQQEEVLHKGLFQGISYQVDAVLLVGSNPAPSPFNNNFNPMRLPRIRASEMNTEGVGLYDWLAYFKDNPQERYISDGNPHTVTVPDNMIDQVNLEALGDRELAVYKSTS